MLNLGEYRKYVTQEEKIEKEYKIKFVDNVEKTFEAKGVINAIKSYINENIINKTEIKEANEEIKAKEAEKVTNENTALSVINAEDIEILKQIIAEYKLKSKASTGAGTNENTKKFDYNNIQIPIEVRKLSIETFSIRTNAELYEKIKEIAKINNISISTLINYLFYSFLSNININ